MQSAQPVKSVVCNLLFFCEENGRPNFKFGINSVFIFHVTLGIYTAYDWYVYFSLFLKYVFGLMSYILEFGGVFYT